MKNGFLNISIVSLLLSSNIVQAAESSAIIPALKPGLGVSITGLLLEPSASNLGYAVFTTPLPLPAPNWKQKIVNPKYSGAFDLGLQYNLMNGNEQVKFDWLYFSSKDQASASSVPNTSVGPAYYFGPAEQFLLNTRANSTVKFTVDDGNVVFGHVFTVTNRLQLEPFIGVNVAYLKENVANNYFGTDPVYGPYMHGVYGKSEFIGIGPRVGVDSSFYLTNHLALTAELAGSLLAGNVQYSTDFTSWTAYRGDSIHNSTPANTAMANQNQYRVVPEMGAKLAALYTISFEKMHSDLTLQAGYLYAVYFNVIQQTLPSTLVSGSWEAGSVAIISQVQQQSNIDLRGPFISASLKF